jgi:hypothetical protein
MVPSNCDLIADFDDFHNKALQWRHINWFGRWWLFDFDVTVISAKAGIASTLSDWIHLKLSAT